MKQNASSRCLTTQNKVWLAKYIEQWKMMLVCHQLGFVVDHHTLREKTH